MKRFNFFKPLFILQLASPLALIIILALYVWLSSRGLDFTDEGYNLLAAKYPLEVKSSLSMWFFYSHILFKVVDYKLVYFRLINIFIELFACVVLACGINILKKTILLETTNYFESFVFISFVCVGGLLGLSLLGFTPSYNTITVEANYLSLGLACVALAKLIQGQKGAYYYWFFAGLFVGLSFFSKFSSSLVLLGMLLFNIALLPKRELHVKIYSAITIILGFVGWFGIFFTTFSSPHVIGNIFLTGLKIDKLLGAGHNLSLLTIDFRQIFTLCSKAFSVYWLLYAIIVGCCCYILPNEKSRGANSALIKMAAISLFIALFLAIKQKLYLAGGMGYYFLEAKFYLSWILLNGVLILTGKIHFKTQFKPKVSVYYVIALLLMLCFLPFIEAIGTNNPIYFDAVLYLGLWFLLIFILSQVLATVYRQPWLNWLNIGLVSIMAIFHGLSGCVHFYRTGSLFEQTQLIHISMPSSNINVDPTTADIIVRLQQTATSCGYQPGQDILGIYNVPGLIYVLGGKSPIAPWYPGGYPNSAKAIEKILSMLPQTRLHSAYILQNLSDESPQPDWIKVGLHFPQGYILCGKVKMARLSHSSLLQLWKPISPAL